MWTERSTVKVSALEGGKPGFGGWKGGKPGPGGWRMAPKMAPSKAPRHPPYKAPSSPKLILPAHAPYKAPARLPATMPRKLPRTAPPSAIRHRIARFIRLVPANLRGWAPAQGSPGIEPKTGGRLLHQREHQMASPDLSPDFRPVDAEQGRPRVRKSNRSR